MLKAAQDICLEEQYGKAHCVQILKVSVNHIHLSEYTSRLKLKENGTYIRMNAVWCNNLCALSISYMYAWFAVAVAVAAINNSIVQHQYRAQTGEVAAE